MILFLPAGLRTVRVVVVVVVGEAVYLISFDKLLLFEFVSGWDVAFIKLWLQ